FELHLYLRFVILHFLLTFSFNHSFLLFFFFMMRRSPIFTLFPYTTLFRSASDHPGGCRGPAPRQDCPSPRAFWAPPPSLTNWERSEEHTSELQSRGHLVCRLLLEKKKNHFLNLAFLLYLFLFRPNLHFC